MPTAIKAHPTGQCGGCFSNTFGDCQPLAKALLGSGKAPSWRTHLLWSDSHTFGDKDIPAITKEAKRWEPLCQKFDIELSPFCEHNLSNPDKYLDIVAKAAPSCKVVNTPWKGRLSVKYKNEVHGPAHAVPSGRYNYSYDGIAVVDSNVTLDKIKFAAAEKFFYWEPRYNGRWEDNDSTPRPLRKGWPDEKLIKSVGILAQDKGTTSLPKNWLYKSHSENKGNGDPRAEKPVVIAPVKVPNIFIGGVPFKYYGPYQDGRHRYYAPKWGYEISKTPVNVVVNGKVVGVVNPSFRDGSFR